MPQHGHDRGARTPAEVARAYLGITCVFYLSATRVGRSLLDASWPIMAHSTTKRRLNVVWMKSTRMRVSTKSLEDGGHMRNSGRGATCPRWSEVPMPCIIIYSALALNATSHGVRISEEFFAGTREFGKVKRLGNLLLKFCPRGLPGSNWGTKPAHYRDVEFGRQMVDPWRISEFPM